MCGMMKKLVVCILLTGAAGFAGASLLDWSAVDWTGGALSQSYVVDGVTIDMTFSGDTSFLLTSAHPQADEDLPGDDHQWNVVGLWWAANFLSGQVTNPAITLTIEFSMPVESVSFDLYDIDGKDPIWEKLTVDGYLSNAAVNPVFSPGAHINVNGNTLESDGTFDASPGNADNTASVGLTFGDSIDTLVLTYESSLDSERGQLLSSINFGAVPEPTCVALLALGGLFIRKRTRT